MKYVLPMSPDYIADWSDWHAVRELLQNAMDAHDAGGHPPQMEYHEGRLIIASREERLSRKSLLLGGGTKTDNRNARGQFGEGYKLALLVFCRKLYGVTIYNGGEVWKPSFEPHPDFENTPVLTIDIRPAATDAETFDGVKFIIEGFPQEAWAIVNSRWLPGTPNDTILGSCQRGNIYSGGLFITQSKSLLRGYNFAPHRLNLGRDRDIVGDFDLQFHTSTLWQECGAERAPELMGLMKVSAADVEYVSYVPEQSAAVILKEYEREYGAGTVPVKDQKELDAVRSSGFNGQIVCNALGSIVRSVKKFVFHELRTPGGRLKAFYEKHRDSLNLDAREELEILVRESVGWR